MIHYITGNLLDANAAALVNTVNTVGVMGKGIALQFKEAFPVNYKKYAEACAAHSLQIGQLLVIEDENPVLGRKTIINFPTKKHWRHPSKYEYIEAGLKELVSIIRRRDIKSVALPPLGCGHGGLDWAIVKPLIEAALADLDADVFVYEPNNALKELLQKEQAKKEVMLTPGRAQLLYLLFFYESLGEHCSLFAANKLAYFLQQMGENLRLTFIPHYYGPYSPQVAHVLYALNGKYLKGFEQKQAKPFEPLYLNYERLEEIKAYLNSQLDHAQTKRLEELTLLIDGFHSELSLEVLASVAFILSQKPAYTADEVFAEIQQWTVRKSKLINKEYVDIAYNRLKGYGSAPLA